MRLLTSKDKGAPDIPPRLLQLHEYGKVVFFVGREFHTQLNYVFINSKVPQYSVQKRSTIFLLMLKRCEISKFYA